MTTTRTITLSSSGSTMEVLARSSEAGGCLSLYRWRMSPTSRGPAPHFHTTFDETFIVEAGEVEYFDGRMWRTLRPGDTAHAPRGEVHALRKVHPGPATVLMALTPGVRREDYFEQVTAADEQDVARLHAQHDNHFVDGHGQ